MANIAELVKAPEGTTWAPGGSAPGPALAWVPWREMERRGAAWDALAARAAEPNPFFESWHLLPSLRALDPGGRVRMLIFEVAGELAGMLPVIHQKRYYRWPVPHLRNWVHDNCFLGTPLVSAGHEKRFWRALLAWGDAHAGAALFLHLDQISLDGPLRAALGEVLAEEGRIAGLVDRQERAMLASDQTPADYLAASLSGKERSELRRKLARLAEQGEVAFTRQTDAAGLDRWIEEFLALESAGWKGKAASSLLSSTATASLFRHTMQGAAAHGRLERLALTLDGRPIAMLSSFLTPPGAFGYKSAFDESHARYSPGVLLLREHLAILERKDIDWFDSSARPGHPTLDHLWRERRPIGRISIAIGGRLRRAAFVRLLEAELGRAPTGIDA